jgi:hypothetical protein
MRRLAWAIGVLAVVSAGCGFARLFQESDLSKAIKARNVNEVRRLLESDPDLDTIIFGAWETALDHLSPSERTSFEIMTLVFAKNPQPKHYTLMPGVDPPPRQTPANARFTVSGRNITGKDRWTTPVEIAARQWSPDAVRFLLANGLIVQDESVQNALVTAASNGCEPIVTMLLDAGADVNGRDKRRDTALAMARRVNNDGIARLLVARGARDQ